MREGRREEDYREDGMDGGGREGASGNGRRGVRERSWKN